MFFAFHVTFRVLCIWPVSEGRREFGELMEGEELDFVCVKQTHSFSCRALILGQTKMFHG